jgi:translation initiation factor 1A
MAYKKPQKKPFKKKKKGAAPEQPAFIRVRTPKGKEVIGTVMQRLGGSRLSVAGLDGKTRVCRIPGRLKKSLWVREGNTVLVEPWEFEGDKKGDVVYKYNPTQVQWLKNKGYLKQISEFEEF